MIYPKYRADLVACPLTDVAAGVTLPAGAVRPAKTGVMKIGPSEKSWIPVLATADAAHPASHSGRVSLVVRGKFARGGWAVVQAQPNQFKERCFQGSRRRPDDAEDVLTGLSVLFAEYTNLRRDRSQRMESIM